MGRTAEEAVAFIDAQDVKWIRLAFCDLFGGQRQLIIQPGELPRALGAGIRVDASVLPGFAGPDGDLVLRADPSTLLMLPWQSAQGRAVRLLCDVLDGRGAHAPCDGRHILRQAAEEAAALGLTCNIGTECEFYLFERDGRGDPTRIPHDRAGYCDIAPLDRGEDVRREICLTLEQMGLRPECSHHEQGPGQNEIDFHYAEALTAADHLLVFQTVVRRIAQENGLFASFLPRPLPGKPGSGLHVHLSLSRDGHNIFRAAPDHSETAEHFIAGVLRRTAEITAFLNPLTNSYERLGEGDAPGRVGWSHHSRAGLVRIPAAQGELRRMELRSPDPCANPYLAFALLIRAGLEGIREGAPLPPPDGGRSAASEELPRTLGEAVERAAESPFVRASLPEEARSAYLAAKRREWDAVRRAADRVQLEEELYFGRY